MENSPDVAGGSLDKGSKNKMKESSKFIGSNDKDDEKKPMGGKVKLNGRNSNEETNEGKTSRKPENIGSKVSKEREESDLELIKEISESSQKQAPKVCERNELNSMENVLYEVFYYYSLYTKLQISSVLSKETMSGCGCNTQTVWGFHHITDCIP